jgi:hypothetical protein
MWIFTAHKLDHNRFSRELRELCEKRPNDVGPIWDSLYGELEDEVGRRALADIAGEEGYTVLSHMIRTYTKTKGKSRKKQKKK